MTTTRSKPLKQQRNTISALKRREKGFPLKLKRSVLELMECTVILLSLFMKILFAFMPKGFSTVVSRIYTKKHSSNL